MNDKMEDIYKYYDPVTLDTLEEPVLLGVRSLITNQELVEKILNAPEGDDDGRSQWYWIRLSNGDLVMACYPHGDTYLETEIDPNRP